MIQPRCELPQSESPEHDPPSESHCRHHDRAIYTPALLEVRAGAALDNASSADPPGSERPDQLGKVVAR